MIATSLNTPAKAGDHFGPKSARGTEVAAMLYGLVECAKASGIDSSRRT